MNIFTSTFICKNGTWAEKREQQQCVVVAVVVSCCILQSLVDGFKKSLCKRHSRHFFVIQSIGKKKTIKIVLFIQLLSDRDKATQWMGCTIRKEIVCVNML